MKEMSWSKKSFLDKNDKTLTQDDDDGNNDEVNEKELIRKATMVAIPSKGGGGSWWNDDDNIMMIIIATVHSSLPANANTAPIFSFLLTCSTSRWENSVAFYAK